MTLAGAAFAGAALALLALAAGLAFVTAAESALAGVAFFAVAGFFAGSAAFLTAEAADLAGALTAAAALVLAEAAAFGADFAAEDLVAAAAFVFVLDSVMANSLEQDARF